MATKKIWMPASIAFCHPALFSAWELKRYENEILANPNATEHDASRFFQRHPKFLHLGQSAEVRREVVLLGQDGHSGQRVDFFRRSFGSAFWDIVELKHPAKPFVVGASGLHARMSSEVDKAINQAQDYRDLIDSDAEVRRRLADRGIRVWRPQIIVVVGRQSLSVNQETLRSLYDRVLQRGPVEAWSYNDIYDFAKEHYARNKLISLPSLHISDEPESLPDAELAELIRRCAQDPSALNAVTPRQFEELVAHIYSHEFGYDVELTPPIGDGGVDIIATKEDPVQTSFMIQVKHFSSGRKVGVKHVRELLGALFTSGGTKGILVTSSSFTQGARRLLAERRWQLEGRDIVDLQLWLKALHEEE